MELTLPMNYVELEQEEMMYLDGGDSLKFTNNINGILLTLGIGAATRKALGIPSNTDLIKMGWNAVKIYYPKFAINVIKFAKNPWVIGILFAASAVAIYSLWNYKLFY